MARKRDRKGKFIKQGNLVSDDIFIPNHSGMLDAGKVHRTPTDNLDPVNKTYVDTQDQQIIDDFLADHPHQDVNTTASPEWVDVTANSINLLEATPTANFPINILETVNVGITAQVRSDNGGANAFAQVRAISRDEGGSHSLNQISHGSGRTISSRWGITIGGWGEILQIGGNGLAIGTLGTGMPLLLGTDGKLALTIDDSTQDIIIEEELIAPKIKLTALGGYAIKLTNKTGANSVAGQLVIAHTGIDDAVALSATNELMVIGVFLDGGVSDGSEAWVVVSGIADVAYDNSSAIVRGDRITTGLAGLAMVNNNPSVAVHFQEIGHSIESVTASGTARCVLHFN